VIVVGTAAFLSAAPAPAGGFYIPGVAPVEYVTGDNMVVKAVKLTSAQTQLPYDFYQIPICKPADGAVVYSSENLGTFFLRLVMNDRDRIGNEWLILSSVDLYIQVQTSRLRF
jgi:hypothetical protein